MPLIIDENAVRDRSRPAAIAMTLFTLRCMEQWKHDVEDYDRAMILVAVAAITSERLLRTSLSPEESDLGNPIGLDRLARCNVSSLAAATGINRETTRRKVKSLIDQGLLERHDDGTVTFAPGVLQRADTLGLVRRQIEAAVRLVNDLMRLGVVTAE